MSVTIPMMIPAIAQAIATLIMFRAADVITSTMSFIVNFGGLPCITSMTEVASPMRRHASIPIKAAYTAVRPMHKNATMTTSGKII